MDLQLPMQSVHITTIVMSSNADDGEVCLMQFYVIKFVSVLRKIGDVSPNTTNKADRYDMTEIVLKVAINTINTSP